MEIAKYLVTLPLGGVAGYVLVTRGGERALVGTLTGFLVLVAAVAIFAMLARTMMGAQEALGFFQRGVLFWSASALVAWTTGHGLARDRWSLSLFGIALGNVVGVAVLRLLLRGKPSAA
jgi:hypothetical protein